MPEGGAANRWGGLLRVLKTPSKKPSTPVEALSPRAAQDSLEKGAADDPREVIKNFFLSREHKGAVEIRMLFESLHDPVWLLTHTVVRRGIGSCSLLRAVMDLCPPDSLSQGNKIEALLKYVDAQLRVYCSCALDPEAALQTDLEMFKKFLPLPQCYASNDYHDYRSTVLTLATKHKLKHVVTFLVQQIQCELSSSAQERLEGYLEALKYLEEGEPVIFPLKSIAEGDSSGSQSHVAAGREDRAEARDEGWAEYKNVPGCIDDQA